MDTWVARGEKFLAGFDTDSRVICANDCISNGHSGLTSNLAHNSFKIIVFNISWFGPGSKPSVFVVIGIWAGLVW